MLLDFGSGHNPKRGFKTCDFTNAPFLDYVYENGRINAENESFLLIRCRNVLHHIKEIKPVFQEFHRVLKVGGKLLIIDANKDHFHRNCVLDLIWYRYVTPRHEIWISSEYRDFSRTACELGFFLIGESQKNEKIVLLLEKRR